MGALSGHEPALDEETIDSFLSQIDDLEQMYEEIAAALGVALIYPRKQHGEVLAKAKACHAAHEALFRTERA